MAAQGPYFLIRRSSAFSYLYVENDKVYASTGSYTPQEILDRCQQNNYYYNYVWELVPYGSSYRLRNVQTGDYIENVQYNPERTPSRSKPTTASCFSGRITTATTPGTATPTSAPAARTTRWSSGGTEPANGRSSHSTPSTHTGA